MYMNHNHNHKDWYRTFFFAIANIYVCLLTVVMVLASVNPHNRRRE